MTNLAATTEYMQISDALVNTAVDTVDSQQQHTLKDAQQQQQQPMHH